jgi:hypothetical protein
MLLFEKKRENHRRVADRKPPESGPAFGLHMEAGCPALDRESGVSAFFQLGKIAQELIVEIDMPVIGSHDQQGVAKFAAQFRDTPVDIGDYGSGLFITTPFEMHRRVGIVPVGINVFSFRRPAQPPDFAVQFVVLSDPVAAVHRDAVCGGLSGFRNLLENGQVGNVPLCYMKVGGGLAGILVGIGKGRL